ncbi:MAG: Holliday junction branch migration protein RuvA [Anaerolineae bacterium]|nr:Holliday junction branch migration protein RuvA [Anaerolineae bacterium]
MIAAVQGRVLQLDDHAVVLMIGGIGLEINATRAALERCREADEPFLYVRLVVREDSLTLFGFVSEAERQIFDDLVRVSGVGPRLALAILSHLAADHLRAAVAQQKPELLTRVPGIGKKTAEKILLELKDKLSVGLAALASSPDDTLASDVMDALIALGFSVVEAQSAIQALPKDAPRDLNERIRLCLQALGG